MVGAGEKVKMSLPVTPVATSVIKVETAQQTKQKESVVKSSTAVEKPKGNAGGGGGNTGGVGSPTDDGGGSAPPQEVKVKTGIIIVVEGL
jgi:hypothetical protein